MGAFGIPNGFSWHSELAIRTPPEHTEHEPATTEDQAPGTYSWKDMTKDKRLTPTHTHTPQSPNNTAKDVQ